MRCGLLLVAGGTVCPSAWGQSNRTLLYSAFMWYQPDDGCCGVDNGVTTLRWRRVMASISSVMDWDVSIVTSATLAVSSRSMTICGFVAWRTLSVDHAWWQSESSPCGAHVLGLAHRVRPVFFHGLIGSLVSCPHLGCATPLRDRCRRVLGEELVLKGVEVHLVAVLNAVEPSSVRGTA